MWILTLIVLAIAPLFWFLAATVTESRVWFNVLGSLVAIMAIAVFLLARPQSFEVTPTELVIHWGFYNRVIPRSTIVSTQRMSSKSFQAENGLAMRIGVGGLFGGFGWLWTSKGGTWEMYVTRASDFVAIKLRSAKPLLLTPAHPTEFVAALDR